MKAIYHYERSDLTVAQIFLNDYESNLFSCRILHEGKFSDGFVLYEVPPQNRTLMMYSDICENKCYSGFTYRYFLNLPYLYFGLRYYKACEGNENFRRRYVYPGVHQAGLQLYISKEPIKSFSDKVYTLPLEKEGYVCVDHVFDYTSYDSLEELSSTIITSWYGYHHRASNNDLKITDSGCYCTVGSKISINWDNVLQGMKSDTLREMLTRDKRYSRECSLGQVVIPREAKLSRI